MKYLMEKITQALFPDKSWAFVFSFLCGKDGSAPQAGTLIILGFCAALIYTGITLLLSAPEPLRSRLHRSLGRTITVTEYNYPNRSKTGLFIRAVSRIIAFLLVMSGAVWFAGRVCAANNTDLRASYLALAGQAFRRCVFYCFILLFYRFLRKVQNGDLIIKNEVLPTIHSTLVGVIPEEIMASCESAISSVALISWRARRALPKTWCRTEHNSTKSNGCTYLNMVLDVVYKESGRPYRWLTERERAAMELVKTAFRP